MFNICKKNGINFTGFEITKNDLCDLPNLFNKLIYAAKNGYEVSFGSDTHLSKSVKYYNLYRQNKISEDKFNKLKNHLKSIGDTIAIENNYRKLYGHKFRKSLNLTNYESHCLKIDKPVIKNHPEEPIYAAKEYNRVIGTSFADKVFHINQNVDNKPMFVIDIKDEIYSFNKDDLSKMDYLRNTSNKDSDRNQKDELY